MPDAVREQAIVNLLEEYGYLSTRVLSDTLFVSQPTIRRTLVQMEQEGIIRRNHGGVSLASSGLPKPMSFRSVYMQKEKRMIAQAAASLVEDGDFIFLDTSTTAMCLIGFLRNKHNITVITNSLPALALLQTNSIAAKCTGGDLRSGSKGFTGYYAEQYLNSVYVNCAFFSTPCISRTGRISDYSEQETIIRRLMINHSHKSVYLFDHTKYGRDAAFTVCGLRDVDYLLSNKDMTDCFVDGDAAPFPLYRVASENSVFIVSTKPPA